MFSYRAQQGLFSFLLWSCSPPTRKAVTEQVPLSAKSVRNIHGVLTKALSVAVTVGYLKANPADRTTLPKMQQREIHPLTDEQVRDFLRVADGDEYGTMLKVILLTGLREAEATGLTWDCIDFKAGTVKVCKQFQKRPLADGGATFAPLKNDKTRILRPAPSVMGLLKQRKKEQIEQRFRAGEAWEDWSNLAEQKTPSSLQRPRARTSSLKHFTIITRSWPRRSAHLIAGSMISGIPSRSSRSRTATA